MNILSKLDLLLNEEKGEFDNIKLPNDMENRLRSALDEVPEKKKKRLRSRVAAIIIVVLLLGYNIDTLAYYGKQLIGYENLMTGTLQELNEMGKGQLINKSYTFTDGVSLVLDGVMLDDNQLILFYTIKDPEGDVENKDVNIYIEGSFGRPFSHGGQGQISEDGTTINWVMSTNEALKFFEKTITLDLNYRHDNGDYEYGEIKFKLDRNQAVGKSLRMDINKKIDLGNRSLKVDTMVASPTSTIVRGKVQNIFELGIDYLTKHRIRPQEIQMELIADGEKVDNQASGVSTDNKGISFYTRFDALPTDTKNIELRLIKFSGDHDVKELFEINRDGLTDLNVLDQDIRINEVYEKEGKTYINFTTEDTTLLSRVYLIIDGQRFELEETIPGQEEKIVEGDSAKILYTRTMSFKGRGSKLQLDIQRISYSKVYDELIYSYRLD